MPLRTIHSYSEKVASVGCAAERSISGLCAGTHVLSKQGDIPVEQLRVGTRVLSRNFGLTTLKEIKHTTRTFRPIKILASSLGHNRPGANTFIAPSSLIHIRDWRAQAIYQAQSANVPAWRLVDGEFVSYGHPQEIEVYELFFDRLHVLFADGIEVLSAEA